MAQILNYTEEDFSEVLNFLLNLDTFSCDECRECDIYLYSLGDCDDKCFCEKVAKLFLENSFCKKSILVTSIFSEIDNKLHELAMEYYNAGHAEYFAVCEVVYHKVIRAILSKYMGEEYVLQ